MSHFSKLQTSLFEQEFVCLALDDLDLSYELGHSLKIQGWMDHSSTAQIRVVMPSSSHNIGFCRESEDQPYVCLADWWGIHGYTEQSFVNKVTQRYAYHSTKETLERQGFTLIEEVQEEQRIHLRLRRMA